jgi:UDP-3-O-[3-hydroxymyristoyl] glucosamine N-acyltransferase
LTDASVESKSLSGERRMMLTAQDIADLVGGELRGDPEARVGGVAPLSRATATELSFLGDARYAPALTTSSAGVILVTRELAESQGKVGSRIIVAKPQQALLTLIPRFYPVDEKEAAIHSTARIGRGAQIGKDVSLDEYAVVGDHAVIGDGVRIGAHSVVGPRVKIGAHSNIFPHVTLYPGAELGERVALHSGARVASDGFGYVSDGTTHAKIPHIGRCIIGDDVEIGANTTVDRGSIDDTVIGAGTKIDNLVQIGHNVKIGQLCLIMAQVGIAGSAQIGDGCVLAGQAGLGGHIVIGAGARIGGQSGVFGDVPAGESWSGYPARPHRESLRATGALFKLAGMIKQIEKLIGERAKE